MSERRTLQTRGEVIEEYSRDFPAEIVEILAKNVQEIWNEPLTRTYQWASSDARYFRYEGIPTLQYGPSTAAGIHSYNETAEVLDVVNITKVYICTMLDYLNGTGEQA